MPTPPSLTAVRRSKSPHPASALLVSNYRCSRRQGSTVHVCVCVWARTKGLAALTCRKDVKSVITLADNKWFSRVRMCVCVWIAVKFYTVGFFEKEMQSLYMSVCAFVRPHSMQHLQTQKPSLQWRLMSTHPNVNFFSSTVISQLVFTIHSFFLFHWSIYLLSPCRLDSLVSLPFPLSPSPTLFLWLTSSVGYLAGWLSEPDIWIYYYTTLQVSSLRLSAPVARPCPRFSFSELSSLMPPCACCPSCWLLPYIGENDSSVQSHGWVMEKKEVLVDKANMFYMNTCV